MKNRPKILCVDDEPRVLDGLSLQLNRYYDVRSAPNGQRGIEMVRSQGPFAVVISDMRMPGMDGAAFLSSVRADSPDTVRVLLTGHAELDSAIAAINDGQIFRFLVKPCPPETLRQTVAAAAEQYRLISTERVLLEQTLRGSVKTLVDVLCLCSPLAFGKATRIRDHAASIITELGGVPSWQLEVAAVLSQLGTVVLPVSTLDAYFRGRELTSDERAMVDNAAPLAEEWLSNIPRLESITEWVTELNRPQPSHRASPHGRWADQCIELKILRIASDYDRLELSGLLPRNAIDIMRERVGWYDSVCLDAFDRVQQARARTLTRELELGAIDAGMTLVADVKTATGILVLAAGHQLTQSSVQRLRNYPKGVIVEPIRVSLGERPSS